jgi:hypothetical protein
MDTNSILISGLLRRTSGSRRKHPHPLHDADRPIQRDLQLLVVDPLDDGAEQLHLLFVAGGDLFDRARLKPGHVGDREEQVANVAWLIDSFQALDTLADSCKPGPGLRKGP